MTVQFISANLNGQMMWTLQFPTETICGRESNKSNRNNFCTELMPLLVQSTSWDIVNCLADKFTEFTKLEL